MSKNTQFTEPDPLSAAVLKEAREERKLLAESQARVAELEAEVQTLRNTSVALLDRAEKAEARIATLEAEAVVHEERRKVDEELLTFRNDGWNKAEAGNVSLKAALTEAKAVLIGMHDPQMEVERNSCLHLIGLTLDGHSGVGDVVAAARPLYEAFLSRHGCFPLDTANERQKSWRDAMSNMKTAIDKMDKMDVEDEG